MKIIDNKQRIIDKNPGDYIYFKYYRIKDGNMWVKSRIEKLGKSESYRGVIIYKYIIKITLSDNPHISINDINSYRYTFYLPEENIKQNIYESEFDIFSVKTQ